MINGGADVDLQDYGGWSPLHFAAQACSVGITEVLLKAGAEVDIRDTFGNTPLWRATFESRGIGSVIAALRQACADPFAETYSGISPVALARLIGNHDVAQYFNDLPESRPT